MKELDFDELDRAVNSLAVEASKKEDDTSQTNTSNQVLDNAAPASEEALQTSLSQVSQPKQAIDEQAESSEPSETPSDPPVAPPLRGHTTITPGRRAARLLVKRPSQPVASKGSVMDIVAPAKTLNHKPSRTAPTLQPIDKKETVKTEAEQLDSAKPDTTPHLPKVAVESLENVPQPSQPSKASSESPKTDLPSKKSDELWPDPLDFTTGLEESPAVPKFMQGSAELANELSPQTAEPEAAKTAKAEPSPSPFIPGAKVEKRPLGAFAATVPPEEDKPEITPPEATGEAPTIDKPADVPEELQPDVLAAEADEISPEPAEVPTIPKPVEHEQPVKPSEESPLARPKSEAAQQVQDSAAMAIPKQYAIPDKPVDDAARPVFDTKEYHPPLLEATVHGSYHGNMWGKLFLALLVLVLLVVGGYFIFAYMTQA